MRGNIGSEIDYFRPQYSKDGGPWTDLPTPQFAGYSRRYWQGAPGYSPYIPFVPTPKTYGGGYVVVIPTRHHYEELNPGLPTFGGDVFWDDWDTLFYFATDATAVARRRPVRAALHRLPGRRERRPRRGERVRDPHVRAPDLGDRVAAHRQPGQPAPPGGRPRLWRDHQPPLRRRARVVHPQPDQERGPVERAAGFGVRHRRAPADRHAHRALHRHRARKRQGRPPRRLRDVWPTTARRSGSTRQAALGAPCPAPDSAAPEGHLRGGSSERIRPGRPVVRGGARPGRTTAALVWRELQGDAARLRLPGLLRVRHLSARLEAHRGTAATDPAWTHWNQYHNTFTVLRRDLCPDICRDIHEEQHERRAKR